MTDSSEKMPPPEVHVEGTDTVSSEPIMTKQEQIKIEREQEQKLKAKFSQPGRPVVGGPGLGAPGGGAGGGGHSSFLQKRLAKGQKYFDSGDYQMAKQKSRPGAPGGMMRVPVLAQPPTGHTIPTPDTVPQRKTSIIQPLHDHSQSMHLASDPAHHAGLSHLLPQHTSQGQPMPNPAIAKLAL